MRNVLAACLVLLASLSVGGGNSAIIREYRYLQSGYVDVGYPGTQPTFNIDFSQDPSGATITSNSGHVLTKNGTPDRVNDGTWPAGVTGTQGYAHTLDGATDYYTCADANCPFDPAGDFSVQCVITPTNVVLADHQSVVAKELAAGNQRGWKVTQYQAQIYFFVSDDGTNAGGHQSFTNKSSALALLRPAFVTIAYDFVADGSSVVSIYVDNLSTASSSTFDGPPFNNTANFSIGALSGGADKSAANISDCRYYAGDVITEAEHDFMFAQWQGRVSSSSDYVSVTSSAPPDVQVAPADNGVEPFLRPQAANTREISYVGTGLAGMGGWSAITNIIPARSRICETPDGSTNPTGWTVTEGVGYTAACTTSTKVDGAYSVQFDSSSADVACVTSGCMTTGIGQNLQFRFFAKKSAGTSDMDVMIEEYDAGDCTSFLQDEVMRSGDLTASWAPYTGTYAAATWHADTSSYQLMICEDGDGSGTAIQSFFDSPLLRNNTLTNTYVYCGVDADTTAVCTSTYASTTNVPFGANETWEVSMNVITPWDGTNTTDYGYFLSVDVPGGNGNDIGFFKNNEAVVYATMYLADATQKSISLATDATKWPADTSLQIVMTHRSEGRLGSRVGSNNFDSLTDALQTTHAGATMYLPAAFTGSSGLINSVRFYRVPTLIY